MNAQIIRAAALVLAFIAVAACGVPIPTPNDFPPPPTGWPETVQALQRTATARAQATPNDFPAPPPGWEATMQARWTATPAPAALAPTATPASTRPPVAPSVRPPLMSLARIGSVQARVVDGAPGRLLVTFKGELPDGCTRIAGIVQGRDGSRFVITVNTSRPAGAMCTMAIVPFEETVEVLLQGVYAGQYIVAVNGVEKPFTLDKGYGASTLPQPPPTAYAPIAWSEAEALILAGQATDIMQTHALEVRIRLKDGRTVASTEPRIDYVLDLIKRCGAPCAQTRYATE